MTTYAVPEDQALADAFTGLAARLVPQPEPVAAAQELASAATPGNGFHFAAVPWGARGKLAGGLRAMAAEGHPLAPVLEGHAQALEDSARQRAVNS